MTHEALVSELRELVAEIVEVDPEVIHADSHLVETLGADSMQALEIVASLERTYRIVIPAEDLPSMLGFSELCAVVARILGERDAGGAEAAS